MAGALAATQQAAGLVAEAWAVVVAINEGASFFLTQTLMPSLTPSVTAGPEAASTSSRSNSTCSAPGQAMPAATQQPKDHGIAMREAVSGLSLQAYPQSSHCGSSISVLSDTQFRAWSAPYRSASGAAALERKCLIFPKALFRSFLPLQHMLPMFTAAVPAANGTAAVCGVPADGILRWVEGAV